MDVARHTYKCKMRFWQDGKEYKVRWFRAYPDAAIFTHPTKYRSRKTWDRGREVAGGLGEQPGSRPYTPGDNYLGFPGLEACGDPPVWSTGGIRGKDTEFAIDESGWSQCCGEVLRPAGGVVFDGTGYEVPVVECTPGGLVFDGQSEFTSTLPGDSACPLPDADVYVSITGTEAPLDSEKLFEASGVYKLTWVEDHWETTDPCPEYPFTFICHYPSMAPTHWVMWDSITPVAFGNFNDDGDSADLNYVASTLWCGLNLLNPSTAKISLYWGEDFVGGFASIPAKVQGSGQALSLAPISATGEAMLASSALASGDALSYTGVGVASLAATVLPVGEAIAGAAGAGTSILPLLVISSGEALQSYTALGEGVATIATLVNAAGAAGDLAAQALGSAIVETQVLAQGEAFAPASLIEGSGTPTGGVAGAGSGSGVIL